ncbi:hypothetical protein JCM14036_12440 [Desulfotomaculum defluvii]
MLTDAKPEQVDFLQKFFGSGNQILLDDVLNSSGAGHIRPWVQLLLKGVPTVLPRRMDRQTMLWYGICFTQRQLKKLGDDLMAFVGPTYANFKGSRDCLDPKDPLDQAVQQFTRGAVYKFTGDTGEIWKKLEMMRGVWEQCPTLVTREKRPLGRVLRDFYVTLRTGSRVQAEGYLEELRNYHTLEIFNVTFLKVQMLAEFREWHEILSLHNLPELLQIRRPLAVTKSLIYAIYHKDLAVFEQRGLPQEALEHFRGHVHPSYGGNLFNVHSGMRDAEVLKCFMMKAVSEERPEQRDEILTLAEVLPPADKRYLKSLAQLLSGQAETVLSDPLLRAETASEQGDFDLAFSCARQAQSSKRRCQILLRCAYELQSLDSEKEVIKAFYVLSPEEQKQLLSTRLVRTLWEDLIYSRMLDLLVNNKQYEEEDFSIFQDLLPTLETLGVNISRFEELRHYGLERWKDT